MTYSAKAIANEFLNFAKQDNIEISQMKLQKLVYISHGFCLALLKKPLIGEKIEAWKYGPVISCLYNEFKNYGSSNITSKAKNMIIDDDFNISTEIPKVNDNDSETIDLLKAVWEKYKVLTASNLSDLTHRDGTPWAKVFKEGVPNLIISNEIITEHYKQLLGIDE